jgi:iron(III) transport system permease protein
VILRTPTPWRRIAVVIATGCAVLMPLGIILYQSFLDAPFFMPAARMSLSAYRYVLWDGDFHRAFLTSLAIAMGMTAIAVPL